jgi:hypothetical protein
MRFVPRISNEEQMHYERVLRRQLEEQELVVRQSPASKDVNTEAEEADTFLLLIYSSLIREVPVSNLCTDTDVGSEIGQTNLREEV